jgi:hypothetical protein
VILDNMLFSELFLDINILKIVREQSVCRHCRAKTVSITEHLAKCFQGVKDTFSILQSDDNCYDDITATLSAAFRQCKWHSVKRMHMCYIQSLPRSCLILYFLK